MIYYCEVYKYKNVNDDSEDPQYIKSIEVEGKNWNELESKVFELIRFSESYIICDSKNNNIGNIWFTSIEDNIESCRY